MQLWKTTTENVKPNFTWEGEVFASIKCLKEEQVAEGQFDMYACSCKDFKRWNYFYFFQHSNKV